MSPRFVIKSKAGYVTGFSRQHEIVQVTDKAANAKRWITRHGADDFIDMYADAGYGLTREGTAIIPEDEAQDIPAKKAATEEDSAKTAGVIDLTPTWSAVVPVLIAALEVGTDKGVQSAEKELKRMARIMDKLVEERKGLLEAMDLALIYLEDGALNTASDVIRAAAHKARFISGSKQA